METFTRQSVCRECDGEGMRPGIFNIVRTCPSCEGRGSLRVLSLFGWVLVALILVVAVAARPYL